jgi:probable lipoprotein NlpC
MKIRQLFLERLRPESQNMLAPALNRMQRNVYFLLVFSVFMSFYACRSSRTVRHTPVPTSVTSRPVAKPAPAAGQVEKVIKTAKSYIGTPYKYAGTTRSGMDCSGLTYTAYQSIGMTLPRSADGQDGVGKKVSMNELRPGDLVFFGARKGSNTITHVGLITAVKSSEITFIHASSSRGVTENNLLSDYYKGLFIKAVRPL